MLADLTAAWRLRSGQAGVGRLAFLSLLIVLAGATDGLGLALLVPLLNSLGATDAGSQEGLFAFLPRTLTGLLLVFLGIVLVRALITRTRQLATARLAFDFGVALRVRAYAAIAHASWSYLRRRRTADLHALFSTEIDRVEHATHLVLEAPCANRPPRWPGRCGKDCRHPPRSSISPTFSCAIGRSTGSGEP